MRVFLHALLLIQCSALPLPDNDKSPQTVGWYGEAPVRGTFGLLVSCVTTMALCVWTAIHLNVPRKGKGSTRERILRKSGWALLGLLAPELVVYAAWKQRAAAQAVVKAVNDELRRILEPVTDSEDTEQTRKAEDDLQSFECRSWSLVHGFFAVMGGFVVKTKDRDQGPFVRGSPRLSLTGRGIVFLARYTDYVPDIEKDAILDRSKADRLAKGLACLQASWMIVQCTGRLVAQLPVTFLEINTLGHAICALLIYLFWIEKPLDVQDPWPIRDDIPRSVIAYMLMCSNGEWEYLKLYGEETLMRDTTANESTISSSYDSYYDSYYLGKSSDDSAHDGIKPSMLSVTQHRIRESTRWPKYQRILARGRRVVSLTFGQTLGTSMIGPRSDGETRYSVDVDSHAIIRWHEASKSFEEFPRIRRHLRKHSKRAGIKEESLVSSRVRDWPRDSFLEIEEESKTHPWAFTVIILSLSTGLYGGLHAAAWKSFFPSKSEKWLWRISALIIAISGIVAAIGLLFWNARVSVDAQTMRISMDRSERTSLWHIVFLSPLDWRKHPILFTLRRIFALIIYCCCVIFFLIYVFARLFLIIEAFISLRKLPIEAYQTPEWTQWIPHI